MSDQTVSNPPEQWGMSAASFYADCQDKYVILHFTVDQCVVGKLLGIDRHDLIVECEEGGRALIPKHALTFIEGPVKVTPPPIGKDYY